MYNVENIISGKFDGWWACVRRRRMSSFFCLLFLILNSYYNEFNGMCKVRTCWCCCWCADDDQMIRRWMLLGWLKRDPSAVIGEDENLIKQNTNILNAFLCTWHWLNVVHKLTAWYIMPANIHFKLVKCLYFDDIWDSFLYYKNPPWI